MSWHSEEFERVAVEVPLLPSMVSWETLGRAVPGVNWLAFLRGPSMDSAGLAERVIRAEEEFVGDFVFLGEDEHVVELPGAVEEGGDVGVEVGVLADGDEAFLGPGMADVGHDHAEIREAGGDVVPEAGERVFEGGHFVEGGSGVEEDGEVAFLAMLVEGVADGVSGVEAGVHGAEFEAAHVEIGGGVFEFFEGVGLGGVCAGEGDEFMREPRLAKSAMYWSSTQ